MALTTSYFAVAQHLQGKKVSVARFHHPRIRNGIDEVMSSFAPSPKLLRDYKDGRITWSDYKRRYTSEQRKHYKESPEDFHDLLDRAEDENIALLCYERFEGQRTKCHRLLLFNILKKVSEADGFDVNFFDETPYRRNK